MYWIAFLFKQLSETFNCIYLVIIRVNSIVLWTILMILECFHLIYIDPTNGLDTNYSSVLFFSTFLIEWFSLTKEIGIISLAYRQHTFLSENIILINITLDICVLLSFVVSLIVFNSCQCLSINLLVHLLFNVRNAMLNKRNARPVAKGPPTGGITLISISLHCIYTIHFLSSHAFLA